MVRRRGEGVLARWWQRTEGQLRARRARARHLPQHVAVLQRTRCGLGKEHKDLGHEAVGLVLLVLWG